MKIPKTISFGGTSYSVERMKSGYVPTQDGDARGISYIDRGTIQIMGKDFPVDQVNETFIHECMHVILHTMGRQSLNVDEPFIKAIAPLVYQLIKQIEEKNGRAKN